MAEADREQLLAEMYGAFNGRDIDGVLRTMTTEVDWPRAFKGDRFKGQEAVRECRRRDLNPRHADYDSAALTS